MDDENYDHYQSEPTAELDPEVIPALDAHIDGLLAKEKEVQKANDFVLAHQEDLKDPLLSGATDNLIKEANAEGKYLEQEAALTQAKQLLDDRLNNSRKIQSVGAAKPAIFEDDLSAAEYAVKHNLPGRENA